MWAKYFTVYTHKSTSQHNYYLPTFFSVCSTKKAATKKPLIVVPRQEHNTMKIKRPKVGHSELRVTGEKYRVVLLPPGLNPTPYMGGATPVGIEK